MNNCKEEMGNVSVRHHHHHHHHPTFHLPSDWRVGNIYTRCTRKGQTTTPGTTSPTLCGKCVGFLASHKVITNKGCESGPTVYRPYPRRLESLTICSCHYKGSTFLLSYLKTPSAGLVGVWTRDLPQRSLVLCYLSHQGLSPLSEKTGKSHHLQLSLQRQHVSPQLFKHPEYCWSITFPYSVPILLIFIYLFIY